MSRTAKRPRGGKSEKASTHMGLDGTNSTMAASPDLMDLGLVSSALPGRHHNGRNVIIDWFHQTYDSIFQKFGEPNQKV